MTDSPRGLPGIALSRSRVEIASYYLRFGQLALIAVLALLPILYAGSTAFVFDLVTVGIYLLVATGLNFLLGFGGQVSLGHGALVGIGGYVAGILMVQHGQTFWVGALCAVLVSSAVGLLMGLPSFRLSSWYFALITLFFTIVVSGLLAQLNDLTGGPAGLIGIPMPTIAGTTLSERDLYWLILALNLVLFVAVRNVVHSRVGRALVAIRDSQEVALANGVSVRQVKIQAFVLSAAVAGLAGALFASHQAVLTPDLFGIDFSIFFLVAVVLGGSGRLLGPVVGTVAFFAAPELLTFLGQWRLLVYGVCLLVVMIFAPEGVAGLLSRAVRRWAPAVVVRRAGSTETPDQGAHAGPSARLVSGVPGASLRLDEVGVRFGGVVALDSVSLEIAAGQVVAIVGSNGSGKTTLLNAMSGYVKPHGGSIRLGDGRIDGLAPDVVARRGVARTFQTPKILSGLSAVDNVMLGAYAQGNASWLEVAGRLPRARTEERRARKEALGLLDFVGISEHAESPADQLPHGFLRLVEIARALLARPRVLLLDEPAAGLALGELDRLAALILEIRRHDITVVIVEHHMAMVRQVADQIVVLDRGRITVSGTPDHVFQHETVAATYMGGRP
jgi:branched-chain amino acid transport system permease protein